MNPGDDFIEPQLFLVDGRRMTALVIAPHRDLVTYDGSDQLEELDPEEDMPGVKWGMRTDAVGCMTPVLHVDKTTQSGWPFNDSASGGWEFDGLYYISQVFTHHGKGEPTFATGGGVDSGARAGQHVGLPQHRYPCGQRRDQYHGGIEIALQIPCARNPFANNSHLICQT